MKKFTILAALIAVFGLVGCATSAQKFLSEPGLPLLKADDLTAAHSILTTAISNGAGAPIQHADSCVVSFLKHPEFQSGLVSTNTTPVVAAPPTVGVVSEAAAFAVKADIDARNVQSKVTLVESGLPDDIITGCALLVHDFSAPGILVAINKFLHPKG